MKNQKSKKIKTLLNEGLLLHQIGKLGEAKLIYESILKTNSKQFEALHYLGTVYAQMGQYSNAIEFLKKAISINPKQYDSHSNLGNAFIESNQYNEAIMAYDNALKLKPNNPKDLCNKGIALNKLKKHQEAINCFDKALELRIDFVKAHINKGFSLVEIGEIDEAVKIYERLILLDPLNIEAYTNLGLAKMHLNEYENAIENFDKTLDIKPDMTNSFINKGVALIKLGKIDLAFECFQRSVDVDPHSALTHYNLGVTQSTIGYFDKSINCFNKAIEINPEYADAYSGRAVVEILQGKYEDAVDSYKTAIKIDPNNPGYYLNLGNALTELRRYDECLASYDRAIELKIDYASAYANRGFVLLTFLNDPKGALVFFEVALGLKPDFTEALINQGQAYSQLELHDKSLNSYLRALEINPEAPFVIGKCLHHKMKIAQWDNLFEGIEICKSLFHKGIPAAVPFESLVIFDDPEIHFLSAKFTNDLKHENILKPKDFLKRKNKEKIRIGYYSADLYYHPVSIWLAEQIENHDRNKFELYAFCLQSLEDPMRTRLEEAFDHWIEVENMSDAQITSLSRDLEIDIAIDLNGHTAHNRPRIFSARAAPIQVSSLGYPGTMAVDYIDYFICDKYYMTENMRKYFSEKIAFVPCPYTYDRQRKISNDSLTRLEFDLPENCFVFTCQNTYQKIMPEVFAIWMDILIAVPKSVLWLADQYQIGKDNLIKEAQLKGVASNRLIFNKRYLVPKDQEQIRISRYLASYKLADLFLDTWPYNAGTTAVDALWAGLPVLTKEGLSSGARMAGSALNAIEMPELIAKNQNEYKNLAIRFAKDEEYSKQIKDKLRHNILTTKLFDPVGNTKVIEKAYIEMVSRYHAGQNPEDIYIKN